MSPLHVGCGEGSLVGMEHTFELSLIVRLKHFVSRSITYDILPP